MVPTIVTQRAFATVVTRALKDVLVADGDGWCWRDNGQREPAISTAPLGAFLPDPIVEIRMLRAGPHVLLSPRLFDTFAADTRAALEPLLRETGRVLSVDAVRSATKTRSTGRQVCAVPLEVWQAALASPHGHAFAPEDAVRILDRAAHIAEADRAAAAVQRAADRCRRRFYAQPDGRWWPYWERAAAAWSHVEAALADLFGGDETHAFIAAEERCWRCAPPDLLLLNPDECRAWALAVARSPLAAR